MQQQLSCHSPPGNPSRFKILAIVCAGLAAGGLANAQPANGANTTATAREQLRQEERIKAIREQQERSRAVLGTPMPPTDPARLTQTEKPCFVIERLLLKGDESNEFYWLLKTANGPQNDDAPQGKCLGGEGINLIFKRMQNALISKGFLTTRVTAGPQDLKTGDLWVTLTPGRIHDIRFAQESSSSTSLRGAMPFHPGDILNLRDIEQGLENLKAIPTAEADIKIIPAELEGQSDVVVIYSQTRPWRGTVTVDDGGSQSTGKIQAGLTLAYDNPAGLNDLLYASLNHNLGLKSDRGTNGGVVHYSIPWGYWSASATYDQGSHRQTIAGAFQNYTYSGRQKNAEIKISRLVHRDATSKTTVEVGAFQRSASNFIDDTEVQVQRRQTGGWLTTLNHRRNLARATLDITLGYKKGTGSFGAISAPEEAFGEGTSRFGIGTANVFLSSPFTLLGQPMTYQMNWRGQKSRTRLAPPERFSIGGRHTVRGFDGEAVLSSEDGWLVRNDISTSFLQGRMQGYVGLDYGQVSGASAEFLAGKKLAGAVIGVRGSFSGVRAEVFVGAPLFKPEGFVTAKTTAGVNFSYSF